MTSTYAEWLSSVQGDLVDDATMEIIRNKIGKIPTNKRDLHNAVVEAVTGMSGVDANYIFQQLSGLHIRKLSASETRAILELYDEMKDTPELTSVPNMYILYGITKRLGINVGIPMVYPAQRRLLFNKILGITGDVEKEYPETRLDLTMTQ